MIEESVDAVFGSEFSSWSSTGEQARINYREYVYEVGTIERELKKTWFNKTITISAKILMRSGYYAGGNLDYKMAVSIDYDEIDDIFEIDPDAVRDCYNLKDSRIYNLVEYHSVKFTERLQGEVNKFRKEIEKELSALCGEEYTKIGGFSNGEAIYQKVT